MDEIFDVVIVGSGPGGEGAAMRLVKAGRSVAMVEKYHQVGGGCTHWGTIPSKALRHNVQVMKEYQANPLFQEQAASIHVGYPQMLEAVNSVVAEQVRTRQDYYLRNQVPVIHGFARFDDANTLAVMGENGKERTVRADQFVLALGSSPYQPADVDFSHPRVLDSDAILRLDHTPRSICIYGAGVIGCEYASFFAQLGVKVNLINTRGRLLSFLDDEITDALGYYLRDHGVMVRHDEEYESVETMDDGVVLHCRSGKKIKTDVLLWANGRSGNTGGMNLEQVGIEINHRGQIVVNEDFQTALPHIYAVGDVIGPPALASASYDQGRYAGGQIVGDGGSRRLIEDIPTGIYTSPEISSVGRTERELTDMKVPYEVGKATFKSLARSQITGQDVGMLKLLFHRDTLELLGIHCFGEQAAEIVHIGQTIMRQEGAANALDYFIDTTFNYPTMAEAYRVAALNGRNRLF